MKRLYILLAIGLLPVLVSGQRLIKSSELPKELLGIWTVPGDHLIDIQPEYIIASGKVWEYLHIVQSGDTIQLIFNRKYKPALSSFTFYDISIDHMKGYTTNTDEINFGRASEEIARSEIPDWLLGSWEAQVGRESNKEIEITRDSISVLSNIRYPIDKVIKVINSWHVYAHDENTLLIYQFQPTLDHNLTVMDGGRDGRRIFNCTKVDSQTTQPETSSSWEDISPSELPDAMLGNWNWGSSTNHHAEILKEYFAMGDIAYKYKRVAKRDNHYLIHLISQKGFREKQLIFSNLTGNKLTLGTSNMKPTLTRRSWSEDFSLIEKPELPENYSGKYYQEDGEQALAFEVHEDKIIWQGDEYVIKRLIKQEEGFRITCMKNHHYYIFNIRKIQEGTIDVSLGGTAGFFRTYRHEPLPPKSYLGVWISLALLIISGLLVWKISRWRSKQLEKKEIARRRLLEMELRAIRAQMNPHFMFNSLNSIQNLIHKEESEAASHYLTQFSGLMRNVLTHSEDAFIPLSEEIRIITSYFELESLRFDFDYEIDISPNVDIYNIEIPGMILQPHVENAIIHGISQNEQKGFIHVQLSHKSNYLYCSIEDNGIGIYESQALKELEPWDHEGHGIRLSNDRLSLIEEQFGQEIHVQILDKQELDAAETGTIVTIRIPLDL